MEGKCRIPRKKSQGIKVWIRASAARFGGGAGLMFVCRKRAPSFPGLRRLTAVEGGRESVIRGQAVPSMMSV